MRRSEWPLMLAGLAAGIATAMAGVSATIALIAITHPAAALAASATPLLRNRDAVNCGVALVALLGGFMATTDVVRRRPLIWQDAVWCRSSGMQVAAYGLITAVILALSGSEALLSISAFRGPLTDAQAFGGLSVVAALCSTMLAGLSWNLLQWWRASGGEMDRPAT